MDAQQVEIASWQIVSELCRYYPERFKVIETHPGGGEYDCLSLYDKGPVHIADFVRGGHFHVFNRCDSSRELPEPLDIWEQMAGPYDLKAIFDQVRSILGLPLPAALPQRTASSVVYRFIATFLTHVDVRLNRWECRNGWYEDTSGYGGGVVWQDFERFPEAKARLQVKFEDDILGQPAYRFWFLRRDNKPVLCLETSGVAWIEDGRSFDLVNLYEEKPDIWLLVMDVAGHLLK